MRRNPITLEEKVRARYSPGPQSQCWPWRGSVDYRGLPRLNLLPVQRTIYQIEIGPIPPGVILERTDHGASCKSRLTPCIHDSCVNPWHVRLTPSTYGLYEREGVEDPDELVRLRKRRVRARQKAAREESHEEGDT